MTLYIIGLGLDTNSISLKGLEAVRKSSEVYLESYTSAVDTSGLEDICGKKIMIADRSLVENDSDRIILPARESHVCFLVIGDPLSAMTHTDLILRARGNDVDVEVIGNASVLTAVGITGLQLYKFGKTTSIPFHNADVVTPYNVLADNLSINAHTLFLLDLDPLNGRYLSIKDALAYLLKVEEREGRGILSEDTLCIGCARLGTSGSVIKAGPLSSVSSYDFGSGPFCLIIPSDLHFAEEEFLQQYKS